MENKEQVSLPKQESPDALPSLIEFIVANEVDGFDDIRKHNDLYNQSASPPTFIPSASGAKTDATQSLRDPIQHQRTISISMPPSPLEAHISNTKRILLSDDGNTFFKNGVAYSSAASKNAGAKKVKFHSQPITMAAGFDEAVANGYFPPRPQFPPRNPKINKLRDGRYNSFKTWSGKLERQLSHLRGKSRLSESEEEIPQKTEVKNLHVDRYFDALEGPELDTLRDLEEILLPEDKQWPFLLRFPISSFGICLGLGSQAIMWKTLATSNSTKFLHISPIVNLILWCISLFLMFIIAIIYSLKVIFYFEAVRREYYHPIRVNFFFAPWIAILFLALGVPASIAENLHASMWYILMAPIFCLEVKIYGQWMSGGQRRLSKVANPSNHLSVVGNFVGALLGASMGLKEGPIFFFAIGLAHYIVLFVTLYQRLPTNETLPKELHPVFFLFVAAPSVASMAWAKIQGSFDDGSRIAYFIAFSLAWWAYTFPMTGASIATLRYSNTVENMVTRSLSLLLCSISTITVTALLVTTIIHAFVLRDLFPNDIAIAISERRPMSNHKWYPGSRSLENVGNYLKYSYTGKEGNVSMTTSSSPKEDRQMDVMEHV
ncbi:hypothetical protein LguiA_024146 [Lonicera macranthoides]